MTEWYLTALTREIPFTEYRTKDEFILSAIDYLSIIGAVCRGAVFAKYEFLHRCAGRRWFAGNRVIWWWNTIDRDFSRSRHLCAHRLTLPGILERHSNDACWGFPLDPNLPFLADDTIGKTQGCATHPLKAVRFWNSPHTDDRVRKQSAYWFISGKQLAVVRRFRNRLTH